MAELPGLTREPVPTARVVMSQSGTLSPLSVLTGSYPTREMLARYTGQAAPTLQPRINLVTAGGGGCCGGGGAC